MKKLENIDPNGLRRIFDEETKQWYFSVVDVLALLTEKQDASQDASQDAKEDWRRLKRLDPKAGAVTRGFRLPSRDNGNGKNRIEDCATAEGMSRIVQSLSSEHEAVEQFKLWLAKLAKQRIEEVQDPAKAIDRARQIYRDKGYPEDWVDVRLKSIIVREELTDEWSGRGVKIGRDYAILTSIISREAFGVTTRQHKELKGLKSQSLRDHMSQVELVLTMLGEVATTEIVRVDDAQGFEQNKSVAKRGGRVAGSARKQIEGETGSKVVTNENFLPKPKEPAPATKSIDDIPF
ncbi:MAG: DNA-damage-inducible protein D [Cellvibrionaceae bacterium]|jgi:DNA-damage-inducible protein D